ncbi:MAG: radical SAM protein [Desulfatibacillum sp.]|nr:radical SAM protein [Desulfatibacillum sp.]
MSNRKIPFAPSALLKGASQGLNQARSRLSDRFSRFDDPLSRLVLAAYKDALMPAVRLASAPLFGATAMISLTYQCQCSCSHCGSRANQRQGRPELSKDQIVDLIEQCSRAGTSNLYLFGGEPLLHPDLDDFIKTAKGLGMRVSLDTNGLLLEKDRVKSLAALGVDHVRVSIDNARPRIHDAFRGVDGLHARAVQGIKWCLENGIRCDASAVATKKNLQNGDLQAILDLADGLGARVRMLTSIMCGGWEGKMRVVLSYEEIAQMRKLLKPGRVYWESDWINRPGEPFSCAALDRLMFHVTAFGDVQPCCYMEEVFGNVTNEPLFGIVARMWQSNLVQCYRKYHDCPVNRPFQPN